MTSQDARLRLAAGCVLAAYIVIVAIWSFQIPLGGGIDEPRHLRYVQVVAEEGRLPTPAEKQEAISHHPPLHYLILAPVYLATRGMGEQAAWHALRLAQIPLSGAMLLLVFAMVRRLVPERPWAAVVAMASIALLPHVQLISAVLSNDITTALFCALMLYFVIRGIGEPDRILRWGVLAGLGGGLAALTRTNAMALIPVGFAAVALTPLLVRREVVVEADGPGDADAVGAPDVSSLALRGGVAFAGAFSLTGGLWLARHIATWGGIDPDPPWPEYTWPVHTFGAKFLRATGGLFRSWWAQVGWIPGPHSARPPGYSPLWPRPDLETPVFAIAAVVTIVAAVGVIVLLVQWLSNTEQRGRGLALATLTACWLLTAAAVIYNAMYVNPGRFEGGRYALPAVAAAMALLAVGPIALPRRWTIAVWVATVALLAAMTAISFWEMHTYLIPTFAK